MECKLADVAEWVAGELDGSGAISIHAFSPLSEAKAGALTFVSTNKMQEAWDKSQASAALVPLDFPSTSRPVVRVAQPQEAFTQLLLRLRKPREPISGVHPTAQIHPTAKLGADARVAAFACIGAHTVIGDRVQIHPGVVIGQYCQIGSDVELHAHVVLYDESILQDRVIIHANSVIGADGFGYATEKGQHHKIPQLGSVIIESDVEIGACSTIDRGTYTATRIGTGTKIDNQVMVGHNCQIGRHNIFCAQVGLAGSCTTGDYVILAGQVGVADHLSIGDQSVLTAQTGLTRTVPPKSTMTGSPAMEGHQFSRAILGGLKLPELQKEITKLKQKISELTSET